ncbi:MAG: hypothetical protein EBY52_08475 [Actinobacteria bacterium]|nr:hypothetical protein [Actinomycetota bacterium]
MAWVLIESASAIRGESTNCQVRPPTARTETAEMIVAVLAFVMTSPRRLRLQLLQFRVPED